MKLAVALIFACLALSTTGAQAYWTSDVGASVAPQGRHQGAHAYRGARGHAAYHRAYRHAAVARHGGYRSLTRNLGYALGLSPSCRQAAALGGPCGCRAAEIVFGSPVRNLWTASSWYKFPRTAPAPGMVAIWGHHHVEVVTAVNGDGTVSTQGSVGFSRAPINHLAFVNPHGH